MGVMGGVFSVARPKRNTTKTEAQTEEGRRRMARGQRSSVGGRDKTPEEQGRHTRRNTHLMAVYSSISNRQSRALAGRCGRADPSAPLRHVGPERSVSRPCHTQERERKGHGRQ